MSLSRRAELWVIAVLLGATSLGVWAIGEATDSSLLSFAGFMIGACTFVPLPADAWVISAAVDNAPATIGLVGGAINAAVVLVEREWVLRFVEHSAFDRFKAFVGTNRWIQLADRYLFVGLLVAAFSFLPFEPFRLLAILRNYSPPRYALATFLGRGFRYYCLARIGAAFAEIGVVRYVVWASLALFAFGLIRSYLKFRSDEAAPAV